MTSSQQASSPPKEFLKALESLIDASIEQGHGPEAVMEVLKEQGSGGEEQLEAIVRHFYKQKLQIDSLPK